MATEHGPDQLPFCFVLRTDKPHLLLYKSDGPVAPVKCRASTNIAIPDPANPASRSVL